MKKLGLVLLAVMCFGAANTYAIDRGAKMIDTFSFDYGVLDDVDFYKFNIVGESAVTTTPRQEWAVLFGGGYGRMSPDDEDTFGIWSLSLGLKYYLTELTSVSGLGTYTRLQEDGQEDIKAGVASLKHRLVSPTEPVCPYAKGFAGWRDRSSFSNSGSDDSFSEFIFGVGGGIEFTMGENYSIIFEGVYTEADDSPDDTEDLDGWIATFGLQYYFMPGGFF